MVLVLLLTRMLTPLTPFPTVGSGQHGVGRNGWNRAESPCLCWIAPVEAVCRTRVENRLSGLVDMHVAVTKRRDPLQRVHGCEIQDLVPPARMNIDRDVLGSRLFERTPGGEATRTGDLEELEHASTLPAAPEPGPHLRTAAVLNQHRAVSGAQRSP